MNRDGVPVLSSGLKFSVEQPTVSSKLGPVSGGVDVMISRSKVVGEEPWTERQAAEDHINTARFFI